MDERLTTKCSTIMIAHKGETLVYHSLDEVPDDLREKLLETTQGVHSATILIADKRGRQEILQTTLGDRTECDSKLVNALLEIQRRKRPAALPRWMSALPVVGRILLVGSLGYVLWILATLR
jgi:hypothetical protein